MTREDCAAGAKMVLELFNTREKREVRAILHNALKQVQVAKLADSDIAAAFIPGLAFVAKKIATSLGCSVQRVAKVALASGCTMVTKGVFQAPSSNNGQVSK